MEVFDVAVIGGGAAGLAAATRLNRRSVLLEADDRVGKKILATGNGRCNLTNANVTPERYNNPAFVSSVLKEYSTEKILSSFASMGLVTRREEDRYYPYSEQASAVLDVLRQEVYRRGVKVETGFKATKIEVGKVFKISACDRAVAAKKLIFASGSHAGFGSESLQLLEDLGFKVNPQRPALTPLRCDTAWLKGLNGIRIKCKATLTAGGRAVAEEVGEVLFKDYGLSGIAVFNLSLKYVRANCPVDGAVSLNLVPDIEICALRDMLEKRIRLFGAENFFTGMLHKNLGANVLSYAGIEGAPTAADIDKLTAALTDFSVKVKSAGDYSQAQVCCGGLDVSGFDSATLQSLVVPGLFAAGEALDVDGECGGFNLHWAWASGFISAEQAI